MNGCLDEVERAIVRALHVNPRASWGQIARALEMSEATTARRAQRLFSTGMATVVGVIDRTSGTQILSAVVRISCRPGDANGVAQAVAKEPWVRFVAVVTGWAACLVEIVAPNQLAMLALLEDKLGSIPGVTGVSAQIIFETLTRTYQWVPESLPPSAVAELRVRPTGDANEQPVEAYEPTEQELAMMEALRRDGRTSLVELAAITGFSQSTARRKMEALIDRGVLHFRLLIEPSRLGFGAEVMFWMHIPPSVLPQIARGFISHPALRYLIVTGGTTNLFGSAVLRSAKDIMQFTTEILSGAPTLDASEVQLVLSPIKRHWHLV